ncbi:shikimate kinase [Ferroplasma acidiphilum]|uniref:shikimate kinase n=1 Tax=Ferroplasma acidiphilum TaxID=74969 RepID=UPI0023F25EA6|nr:shikimate kinase [Ferroplasma acidiphilum]MCL4349301.1 shikimate kinase [Candidatus Thermoplasmatota archaeon]
MIIKTNGGLSVLSAFVNGYGAAISIDLPMYTEIKKSGEDIFPTPEMADTVNFLRNRFSIHDKYSININSQIPMGMGLKSSSAMTLSLIYGIFKINHMDIAPQEVLKIASETSIHNKTSVTGAIDDLSIAYYGGFCFTDNSSNRIISKQQIEEKYIILELQDRMALTYDMRNRDFSGYKNYYGRLLELVKDGHIFESMMLNGYIFSDGTETGIVKKMLGTGAIYAGRSGKGPAIFGIYETESSMESSFKQLTSEGYNVIRSRFNNYGINIYEQ